MFLLVGYRWGSDAVEVHLAVRVFEVGRDRLVPYRQVRGGPDLYERDIECLLWTNLEDMVGLRLFPVARQPVLSGGLRPDIVALDSGGYVYVVEVKRAVDRNQFTQCMEYAAQVRHMNLGDIESIYHGGAAEFNDKWTAFTGTRWPLQVRHPPRLLLVAGDYDDRTRAVLETQILKDDTVNVLTVKVFEDQVGRRMVHIEDAVSNSAFTNKSVLPESAQTFDTDTVNQNSQSGKKIKIVDLIDAELLAPETVISWTRPNGITHKATILEDGQIVLQDGQKCGSPSGAAMEVAQLKSYNGWAAWTVPDGRTLAEIRELFMSNSAERSATQPVSDSWLVNGK